MTWTNVAPTTDELHKELESQIRKGLDDAIDTLKWCRKHRGERKAIDTLRLVQSNLGYLAMALDWEMESDTAKAHMALNRVWLRPAEEVVTEDWSTQGC